MHAAQIQKLAAACDFLQAEINEREFEGADSSAGRSNARLDAGAGTAADRRPDIGDIALATALSWVEFRGVYEFLSGRPQLAAWYRAFSARPSMQATGLTGETRD
jgi:glutathione S-transferase